MSERSSPPPRKVRSRAYHHGSLRAALLEAALAELGLAGRDGPAAGTRQLSLRNLAGRIGVSHAAPYRHFRNKRALLAALAEETERALAERLELAMRGAGSSAEARLQAVLLAYVDFAVENPPRFRVLFAGDAGAAEPGERRDSRAIVELMADAARREQRSPAARRALGTLIWTSAHGLAELVLSQHLDYANKDALERLATLVVAQLGSLPAPEALDAAGASLAARFRVR